MPDLSSTVGQELARYYRGVAAELHTLADPLSEDQFWARPYPYGNSVGHLVLHLTGNLSFYIGANIAHNGYVRNRPLEFTDASRPAKAEVLKKFDEAVAMVVQTIQKQTEAAWLTAYTAQGEEDAGNRFTIFLRCAAHAYHHVGQMIYLCKELERRG